MGRRLRERRQAVGLSQQQLANSLGLSFQQVQKYERGKNSLSSERLMLIAQALGVPVTFFFDGLEGTSGLSKPDSLATDQMSRTSLQLVRYMGAIPDPIVRRELASLAKAMAGEPEGE